MPSVSQSRATSRLRSAASCTTFFVLRGSSGATAFSSSVLAGVLSLSRYARVSHATFLVAPLTYCIFSGGARLRL